MKRLLKLSKENIDTLMNTPESGVGYHNVKVTLVNEKVLENRVVLNSTFLVLIEDENLDNRKIKKIEITK